MHAKDVKVAIAAAPGVAVQFKCGRHPAQDAVVRQALRGKAHHPFSQFDVEETV